MIRYLIALALIVIAPLAADACNHRAFVRGCSHCNVKFQSHYVAPVKTYAIYQVGQQIRSEAEVEKIAARVAAKLSAQFQAMQQPQRQTAGALKVHCGKCHGTQLSAPKGERYFDSGIAMSKSDAWDALEQVAAGTMPPSGELEPDAKGAVMQELRELVKQSGERQSAQQNLPDIPAPPVEPQPNMQGKAARTKPDTLAFFGGK